MVSYRSKNAALKINTRTFLPQSIFAAIRTSKIFLCAGNRIPNINQFPILNKNEASKELEIPFQKDCGQDDECQSSLVAELELFSDDLSPLTGNTLGESIVRVSCVSAHPIHPLMLPIFTPGPINHRPCECRAQARKLHPGHKTV